MNPIEDQFRRLAERGPSAKPNDVVAGAVDAAHRVQPDRDLLTSGGQVRPVLVGVGALVLLGAGIVALVAIGDDEPGSTELPSAASTGTAGRRPDRPDGSCVSDYMIDYPSGPRSLAEIANGTDVLAVVEVARRYQLAGERYLHEGERVPQMATLTVVTPIAGVGAGDQLETHIGTIERRGRREPRSVGPSHILDSLTPGTRLVAGLRESSGRFEIDGGGALLVGDDGTVSVLGRDACREDEAELDLRQEVDGRELDGVVDELRAAWTPPTTNPDADHTVTTGTS